MFITICTPTYNRAYTLPRLYESLLNQTNDDFEWIIVDDGSIDETKELVHKWISEGKLDINYIYQSNHGKHIALNNGMEAARGDMFTCLDSDDWFYNDTVHTAKKLWDEKSNDRVAGFIALDTYEDGNIIGSPLPDGVRQANWIDLIFKYSMKGDKAYFFDTKIIKNYKFPVFRGNKHMPPSYQYYMISKKYDFLLLNKPVKFVEYMDDGISKNKFKKYYIAPDNFTYYRLQIMNLIPSFRRKIINAMHFNATNLMGKEKFIITKIEDKIIIIMTKPIGFLFYLLIKQNNR
ncbi:glycosyltransferase [Salipaludibacillus keqinensis]|uniref:Glycosyltransferase n=1 Tax=Salipaludibacillus keqinensis TaxID=2045207 RepID=A0A323TBI1_9BACI|nr:glycosyltransferase family 2 protein [Salipaludibacillus keqinensis]PYZ92581.1 glycosyltransferase [Salipaludibacillus keqinensis]